MSGKRWDGVSLNFSGADCCWIDVAYKNISNFKLPKAHTNFIRLPNAYRLCHCRVFHSLQSIDWSERMKTIANPLEYETKISLNTLFALELEMEKSFYCRWKCGLWVQCHFIIGYVYVVLVLILSARLTIHYCEHYSETVPTLSDFRYFFCLCFIEVKRESHSFPNILQIYSFCSFTKQNKEENKEKKKLNIFISIFTTKWSLLFRSY